MKIKIKVEQEFDAKYLRVNAGVRYWKDATVCGEEDDEGDKIPCRNEDRWCPIIDIESGTIVNWEIGKSAHIHYKCCDAFECKLADVNNNTIAKYDGYVPDFMAPDGDGYGDYIIMNVDEMGHIWGWKFDDKIFTDEEE